MGKRNEKRMAVAAKRLKAIERLVEPYSEDVSLKRPPVRQKWVSSEHSGELRGSGSQRQG